MDAGPSNAIVQAGAVEDAIDLHIHPSGIVPVLQNVVATVNVGCKLDLRNIALHARNAEYNPKRFAAVIMRIREPKTTALIFASGKMVCTGAKSEEDSRMASRRYASIIKKLGFPAVFKEFKIQNIVGSCDVKFPIRLEGLAYSQSLFSSYEPELFPGLIYRMKVPKIVLLIFVSGKVVLTGAKRREEIYEAFENIYPILRDFRKGDATPLPPMPGSNLLPQAATPASAIAATPYMAGTPGASSLGAGPSGVHHSEQELNRLMLPPPSPARGLPPPTPLHHHGLPPPTPVHHSLPPPTPARSLPAGQPTMLPQASWAQLPPPTPLHPPVRDLPPPTPVHNGLMLPPPSPAHNYGTGRH